VRRTTIRKRMRAKLRQVKQQLRQRMHDPGPKPDNGSSRSLQGTSTTTRYREPHESGRVRDRVLLSWWRTIRDGARNTGSTDRLLVLAQRWRLNPRALIPPDAATPPR